MPPKIQNGARVFLYINGSLVGLVTDFSFSSSTPSVDISGIDVDYPIELGSGQVKTTGSFSIYKLITDSGAQSYGLTTTPIYTNIQKYVTLTLIDRGIDTVIFQADYAKVTNESWQVATKSMMTGNITFEALTWVNSYG